MSTDRDLLQQALDALEAGLTLNDRDSLHWTKTIEAIRARLAQPEPEPVAWKDYTLVCPKCGVDRMKRHCGGNRLDCGIKFQAYSAQPKHLIKSMQSFRDRLCNDERSAILFEGDESDLLDVINFLNWEQKRKCYTAPPQRDRSQVEGEKHMS